MNGKQKQINGSIQCSVNTCAFHNGKNYCTLEQIKVGCCDSVPTTSRGTECASFQIESDGAK